MIPPPERSLRSRLRRTAGVVLVNCLVLGACFVALEVAFGNWLKPNPINRLHLIRNAELAYDVREPNTPAPRRAIYRRDQYGLRGSYRNPSQIDILTIGGSTTDQRNITEGETWQDVLAQTLLARGKPVSVVNAGIDGQSTVGHVKDFDWWFPSIPGFHARFILVYAGINDIYVSDQQNFDDLVDETASVRGRLRTAIKERSALYSVYRLLHGIYLARVVYGAHHRTLDFNNFDWSSEPRLRNHESLLSDRLQAYSHRIEVLLEKIRGTGASPICVTQPSHWYKKVGATVVGAVDPTTTREDGRGYLGTLAGQRVNGLDYQMFLSLINDQTLRTCLKEQALTLDLAKAIEWQDDDYFDFTHNTPKGTRKIGEYLASQLEHLF